MADIVGEDTFTSPSLWCPDPRYWHCEDNGGATENEVTELVAAFVRALQPEIVAETGSYTGVASHAIGSALARNGHGMLHTIELDPEFADAVRVRCAGLPVTVITGSALDWDAPRGIGFAWVDGSWDRDAEIDQLLGCLLPGAIVGIHDTAPHHYGWNGYSRNQGKYAGILQPVTLRTPRGVTFAQVL